MKSIQSCPRCNATNTVKSGIIKGVQRFRCKACNYFFTVQKLGKSIDPYYVVKALQLYMEGISLREIERVLGISHVSVMNWVKKYRIKVPDALTYRPTYKVMTRMELAESMQDEQFMHNVSILASALGDKLMVIKWKRM